MEVKHEEDISNGDHFGPLFRSESRLSRIGLNIRV